MEKIKKTYRLAGSTIKYVEDLASAENITNTQALEKIIDEHQKNAIPYIESLSDNIIKKFDEKYKDFFTRVRLGLGYTDKNVQIAIELLNTILVYNDIQQAYLTHSQKSIVLEASEKEVSERIANYKQKTDELKSKKQVKNN